MSSKDGPKLECKIEDAKPDDAEKMIACWPKDDASTETIDILELKSTIEHKNRSERPWLIKKACPVNKALAGNLDIVGYSYLVKVNEGREDGKWGMFD